MSPLDAAHEPLTIIVSMAAGAVAGSLGALLGIGGGVFLIPLLNVGLGLPLHAASGISLMTVIATSNAVAANEAARKVMNLGLGMLLQIPAVAGGLLGALLLQWLTTRTVYMNFAAVAAVTP